MTTTAIPEGARNGTGIPASARWSRMIGTLAGILLGLVLLASAWTKGVDPAGFAEQIVRLGLLPPGLATWGGILVIGLEAALGLALVAGLRRPPILVAVTLMMAGFVAITAWEFVHPLEDYSSCGCFGNLVQRTPGQALAEDIGFLVLAGLSWLGRPTRPARLRWALVPAGFAAGVALALLAPSLPLDDLATRLRPGTTVASLRLDEIIPELQEGTHLVLLLDRADETTRAEIPRVNEHLALVGGPVDVFGLAEENEELEVEFLWTAGPAFDVRGAPWSLLKPLYRKLPRSFLVRDGVVVRVWNGIPPDEDLDRLASGKVP